jgi:hypothetical protein
MLFVPQAINCCAQGVSNCEAQTRNAIEKSDHSYSLTARQIMDSNNLCPLKLTAPILDEVKTVGVQWLASNNRNRRSSSHCCPAFSLP